MRKVSPLRQAQASLPQAPALGGLYRIFFVARAENPREPRGCLENRSHRRQEGEASASRAQRKLKIAAARLRLPRAYEKVSQGKKLPRRQKKLFFLLTASGLSIT